MSDSPALIAAWARSAVAPHGGAFRALAAHDIAAPVLQATLQRAGILADEVDAVVLGNALGAGGNPARMAALAAGLPDRCAALSVDTQCCAGLDAVAVAVGLLTSGQADVVVAGGVEAWSRAPIRQHRPMHPGEEPIEYERPAFAPTPARDPDLLQVAADYAHWHAIDRLLQDAYAVDSHQRAVENRAALRNEIVPIAGLYEDAYPRSLRPIAAARLPIQAVCHAGALDDAPNTCAVSTLAISPRADGAAMVLLMTPDAARRLRVKASAQWCASSSVGNDPAMPMLAAEAATHAVLKRAGLQSVQDLLAIELHDAFAVQGLSYFCALGLQSDAINRRGGGIARGHPIGASGAIALVRVLADLQHLHITGAYGLAAVAGAGGVGAATIVQWC